jgi:hypothetical protein
MKTIRFSLLVCFAVCASFLTSADANHRTGTLALPEEMVAGDFNGDGNLDLAVNVTGFDNIAIFLGDGAGGLNLIGHLATNTLPKGLGAADINRDGRLDLIEANTWGYTGLVYSGDGKGAFNVLKELKGDGEPTRFAVADFNNDGRLDLAFNSPDEGIIQIYLGDGKGGFTIPAIEIEDLKTNFAIAAADLNNDGNQDIVITFLVSKLADGSRIAVLLGDGTGNFTRLPEFPVNQSPTSIRLADLNHDGKLDLTVAGAQPENTEGNYISTFLGDGTGNFTLKQTITLGPGALKGDIALGDFNEDGKPDVAFPQTGGASTTMLMFFGDGTGGLIAGPAITVGEEPHTAVAADFNKDGHLDVVVSNRTDGTIILLFGDGTGNFPTHSLFSVICPTCLE